jgi:hypothetical protein
MKKNHKTILIAVGIITLLSSSSCVSGIITTVPTPSKDTLNTKNDATNTNAFITCYVSGVPQSQTISYDSGMILKELFSKLAVANAHNPYSPETHRLQQQILEFAEQHHLLPHGLSSETFLAQLQQHRQISTLKNKNDIAKPLGVGQELFCNFVATGEGAAFPIIILPRFIPFIMAPIPRLFVGWKTTLGATSVGGLLSGTGFYAIGEQQGFALGFWGIGFSIFLPPVKAYGMFGYAVYAKASAENMQYYPPNRLPKILQTDPANGEQNVSISTSEFRFEISDADGDLMTYNVTTDPDIGSGSGGLKPDGVYSISLSGLESYTQYACHIQVTDGKDTVEKTVTFTTEATAPIVSDPFPGNNALYIAIETANLSFDLQDYQGDVMDWTVETQPDIGSGAGNGIMNGRYTVPISGLDYFTSYTWFVNATDGEHWTKKTFVFQTIAENTMVFEPTDDATIWENHPDSNTGDSESLSLRTGSGWEGDVLMKFDLSTIPSNVTLQYASLQGYYYRNKDGNPSGHQVNLYRITSDWNEETVTWATHPSYIIDSSSHAFIPSMLNTWILWDVTEDASLFYNSGTPNYGWRMVDISGGYQISSLRSKDYSEYHPLLIIGYE